MNKTVIKNYAIWARVQLIESCKQRAYEYGITEDGNYASNLKTVGSRILTDQESLQRNQLIEQIRQKGYAQVMEEAAYTWFNRFIALRFMEVNGYLPSKVRVFTDENGAYKPELLKEAMTIALEGIDRSIVIELLEKQDNEELYKYLLITQCNALSDGLPFMFEKISNWTELLFPANLLRQDSVVGRLISDIAIEDWDNAVEIIGWFYQYYISEKHEEVVDPLHGKVINKEDIPAATQLFTTDWVVRYILDNSLGRYWIEHHPESKLADKLTYYIEFEDDGLPDADKTIIPEDLKVLDPCVGSGHFLSYAFDILLEIYRECGWSDRDAAKSIIENNLYGLDIDDRAVQLACFAVTMKARKYNRRIISINTALNVLGIQESTSISDELIRYVSKQDNYIRNELNELKSLFSNAKEYGSLIVVPNINFDTLYSRINEIKKSNVDNLFELELQREATELLQPLVQQAEILAGKYDIVITNPPYMNKFSASLKAYIGEHYEAYKGDLFSVFMYRNFGFCKQNGYSGFMTPNVWMFIKTYEKIRRYIINYKGITTLIQMAKGAFFKEATVDVCAFVLKNSTNTVYEGTYIGLEEFKGDMDTQEKWVKKAVENQQVHYVYKKKGSNYLEIPGAPIAFWVSNNFGKIFQHEDTIKNHCISDGQIKTGDNSRFLRCLWEVSDEKVGENKKWVMIAKGGQFRRWSGNIDTVIDWSEYARNHYRSDHVARIAPEYIWWKEGICWNHISSKSELAIRKLEKYQLFETGANAVLIDDAQTLNYILGYLNSKVAEAVIRIINPTLNSNIGDITVQPYTNTNQKAVNEIVDNCLFLSKTDWDSFEISWGFRKHPLI